MENREEILQKLYSIRAGLSTVSVKKDEVVRLDNKISNTQRDIENGQIEFNSSCRQRSDHIHGTKARINECKQRLEKQKNDLETSNYLRSKGQLDRHIESTAEPYKEPNIAPYEKPRRGKMFFIFGFFFLMGIALCIFGIATIILWKTEIMPLGEGVGGGGGILGIVYGIAFAIPFGIVFNKRREKYRDRLDKFKLDSKWRDEMIEESKKDYAAYKEEHIRKLRHYYQSLPESIKKDEELIESLTAKLPILSLELDDYKARYSAQEKQLSLTEATLSLERKATVQYAQGVYSQLAKDYNSFLSTSDWKNLDYIIYLFETGRADSIKESLQLLDQVKRNEMIIIAMGHISNNIRAGFGELKSTMMSGFSSMSSQLRMLTGTLDSISMAQRANAEIFESISGKIDVFNDLTRKANTTSEEMMKDVNYLAGLFR